MVDDLAYLSFPEVRKFILDNEDTNVQDLILHPPNEFKDRIGLIADQIISRKKGKDKLPQWLKMAGVIMPPPLLLEQCSSETTAKHKASVFRGEKLVDLTGGMGVDTLAMSHSFQLTTYVEHDEWLSRVFRHNSEIFSKTDIRTINSSAEKYLSSIEGPASFYLDPARRDQSRKVFRFEDCTPNVVDLIPTLKEKADQVLIKASPMLDIQKGLSQLGAVSQIHIVSINNECKELLFLSKFNEITEPRIHCINFSRERVQTFSFTINDEESAIPTFSQPKKYLYDPNSSILKGGAFKSIAIQFDIDKLGTNTHLYTSNELVKDFPGRTFEVIHQNPSKQELKSLVQANVITKNYPIKAEEIKKKYSIKDGGHFFLFGIRDQKNKSRILLSRKVNN